MDSKILTMFSANAAQQATKAEAITAKVKQFLNYDAMHEDAVLTYKVSDMVLAVDSDAGY